MIALLFVTLMTFPVFAQPSQPTWGTFANAGEVPDGSTLVLNILQKVENSYDSGIFGYWAMITYTRNIQVWEAPEGTFYVIERDSGKWCTFEGALSPLTGTAQTMDGSGTFHGGSIRTMTGTLKSDPGYKTKGSIGKVDYGGTEEYIKLGTYGAQGPPVLPGYFNWMDVYFEAGYTYSYVSWGWTYNYKSQTWNNYDYGNSGDIII
jgi:hypothetical protein